MFSIKLPATTSRAASETKSTTTAKPTTSTPSPPSTTPKSSATPTTPPAPPPSTAVPPSTTVAPTSTPSSTPTSSSASIAPSTTNKPSSIVSSIHVSSPSASVSASANASAPPSSSGSVSPALIGGIVGGAVGLILLSVIIFAIVRRARRKNDMNKRFDAFVMEDNEKPEYSSGYADRGYERYLAPQLAQDGGYADPYAQNLARKNTTLNVAPRVPAAGAVSAGAYAAGRHYRDRDPYAPQMYGNLTPAPSNRYPKAYHPLFGNNVPQPYYPYPTQLHSPQQRQAYANQPYGTANNSLSPLRRTQTASTRSNQSQTLNSQERSDLGSPVTGSTLASNAAHDKLQDLGNDPRKAPETYTLENYSRNPTTGNIYTSQNAPEKPHEVSPRNSAQAADHEGMNDLYGGMA